MKATLETYKFDSSLTRKFTTDIVEGLLSFDGINDYVELSGNPVCAGVKQYNFTLFIKDNPSGAIFDFDDGAEEIRVLFDNVNTIQVDCVNAWSPNYDISPYKNIKAECILIVDQTRIGASPVNLFTINGVPLVQTGMFGSAALAGTSKIGCAVNGALPLSDCLVWDLSQFDNLGIELHNWLGEPEGNTDAAWVDNIGVLDGTVFGAPVTESQTFGAVTTAENKSHHLGAAFDYDYGIPPVPIAANIDNDAMDLLIITFDRLLDPASVPDPTDFVTTGVYLNAQPTGIAIVGDEVRLTLANDARWSENIKVSYVVPGTNALRSLIGSYGGSFTDFTVTVCIDVLDFDGASDVDFGLTYSTSANNVVLSFNCFIKNSLDSGGRYTLFALSNNASYSFIIFIYNKLIWFQNNATTANRKYLNLVTEDLINKYLFFEVTKTPITNIWTVKINGVTKTLSNGSHASTSSSNAFEIGSKNQTDYLNHVLIWDVHLNNSVALAEHQWLGYPDGNLNPSWIDLIDTKNGTVNGAPDKIEICSA